VHMASGSRAFPRVVVGGLGAPQRPRQSRGAGAHGRGVPAGRRLQMACRPHALGAAKPVAPSTSSPVRGRRFGTAGSTSSSCAGGTRKNRANRGVGALGRRRAVRGCSRWPGRALQEPRAFSPGEGAVSDR
jgi:hypothetical protein